MSGTRNNSYSRNYGIDFLRLIAMFFVVVLHSLGHGGVLNSVSLNSLNYKFAWFLEIIAFCAVDMFAIISGYVSYSSLSKKRKIKYSNYINLWLQVVFYGLVICFVLNIINPSIIERKDYITAFFPVMTKSYWYFTAYTGLFIILPFITEGIKNIKIEKLKKLFIVFIITFSLLEIISPKFNFNSGYSFIWITILYVLGAIMKKANIGKSIKNYQLLIIIIIMYFFTFLYKMYGFEISKYGIITITKDTFIDYTSPSILLIAILYVLLFSRLRFNNIINKIIKFVAPSTFAIYLINDNNFIRTYYINDLFKKYVNCSSIKLFFVVISFSVLFVFFSIMIDKIRILIFKHLKVSTLINQFLSKLNKFLSIISKKL